MGDWPVTAVRQRRLTAGSGQQCSRGSIRLTVDRTAFGVCETDAWTTPPGLMTGLMFHTAVWGTERHVGAGTLPEMKNATKRTISGGPKSS